MRVSASYCWGAMKKRSFIFFILGIELHYRMKLMKLNPPFPPFLRSPAY